MARVSLATQTAHALKQAWLNLSTHNERVMQSCTSVQTVINNSDRNVIPRMETIQKGRTYSWISVLNETSTSVFTLAEPGAKQGKPLMHDDGFRGQVPDANNLPIRDNGQSYFDIRAASDSVWCLKRQQQVEENDVLTEQAALVQACHEILNAVNLSHQGQSFVVHFHRTKFTLNEWATFQVNFHNQALFNGAFFSAQNERVATLFFETQQRPTTTVALQPPPQTEFNPESKVQAEAIAGKRHLEYGWGATYGGQLLGQAVFALGQTSTSFHQHFIRGGKIDSKSVITSNNDRGNEVSIALQGEENKVIFRGASVFGELQRVSNKNSSTTAPQQQDLAAFEHFVMPMKLRNNLFQDMGIEHRCSFTRYSNKQRAYVRVTKPVHTPVMNQAILAYVADFMFPPTSITSHDISVFGGKAKLISFSGSFYYFYDVDWSEGGWISLESHCPILVDGRAMVTIDMYTSQRVHFARAVQEVLVTLK